MINKKNRKGQANIITVILIVMIVIVLIAIVGNILIPVIGNRSQEVDIGKFTTSLDIKDAFLFVNGASEITVGRGTGGGQLSAMKFVFYDSNKNSYVETEENNLLNQLETKTYNFGPVPLNNVKRVSVFPVFDNNIGMEYDAQISDVLEIPNGLVSWWRFEDNKDSVGGNDCSDVSIVDSERGKVGSFNNQGISCGNDKSLDVRDKIGISFWIKTNGDGGIIGKGDNYQLSVNKGKIEFSYKNQGVKKIESNSQVNDNVWHHIAVSEDWTGNKNMVIYIDGELDKMGLMEQTPKTNQDSLLIGDFTGFIDEMMFFNESLSNVEVEGIYNNQKI